MAGGMACPRRPLAAICEADNGFIDKMIDLALSSGGRGVEGNLSIVWDVERDREIARYAIERICANAEDPLLLHGAHRALVVVLASMPEDKVLREGMIPWLSELVMRADRPDALVCEAVTASLSEKERIQFVVEMVGLGLGPTELKTSRILYEPDVCSTGSEVSRVDDDARFLRRLMCSMRGVQFAKHRQAIEERLESLGKRRDYLEAREMMVASL